MPRYEVNHRYRAGLYGPWEPKTQVELQSDQADWINHDSPGCLTEVDPDEQARAKRAKRAGVSKKAEPEPEPAAQVEAKGEPEQTLVDGRPAKPDTSSAVLDKATKED